MRPRGARAIASTRTSSAASRCRPSAGTTLQPPRSAAGGLQYGLDWLVPARALLLDAQGDAAAAVALLQIGWETAIGLQATAAITTFGPDLVRLCIAAGDKTLAAEVAAHLDETATRH